MYAVQVDSAAYRYADGRQGLAPISLHVEPGERLLIGGPSGCGKSTLARCLTGLIPHLYRGTLDGAVRLEGLCTATTSLWQLAERAGLVFQNPAAQMLTLTVEEEVIFGLENLGLEPGVIRKRTEAALAQFGLMDLRARAPQTLSSGEQQKLALAVMMARRPPLLVLDEPLSMLDTTASIDLVAHLEDAADSGTAVVVCEHRAEYLRELPGLHSVLLAGKCSEANPSEHVELHCAPTAPFCLRVSQVSVRLGGRPVLDKLDLALPSGQVAAVVGRNGVGKTTLLRSLVGLQSHEGTVTVDGGTPDLGMVFQNADLQLFNPTVRDEILYRLPEPDMPLYAWLIAALGLAAYENTPPLLLSEGEKKRVALATILMRKPRHGVLLDEPTLGQDTAHKAMLVRVARALAASGQLVLITTHDLALAASADRLLLLGPEGIVADGLPEDVLNDTAPWAHLGLVVPAWMRHSAELGGMV